MKNQAYLDQLQEKLYSAVISDILDSLELRNQALPQHIRPLDPDMVVCGYAKTVK